MRNLKFIGLMALVVAHDIGTQIRCAKAARLFTQASEAYEETEAIQRAQIDYLIDMLVKNDIAPDEFDIIALRYHE